MSGDLAVEKDKTSGQCPSSLLDRVVQIGQQLLVLVVVGGRTD